MLGIVTVGPTALNPTDLEFLREFSDLPKAWS